MDLGKIHYIWMSKIAGRHSADDDWWLAMGAAATLADYLDIDDREALQEALMRGATGHMEWLPLCNLDVVPERLLWDTPRDSCWSCCWAALLKARYEQGRETVDDFLVRAMLEEAWRTCPSNTLASAFIDAIKNEATPPLDELIARTSTAIAADVGLDGEKEIHDGL